MIDLLKAAVYCGTYKKYNTGSLAGAWVQLAKYNTYGDFIQACAELHSDEDNPEFMYQDKEYLPDEFYNEEFIYPEIFQVLTTVKNFDDAKQKAFEAYCEQNTEIPDMFTVDEFTSQYKPAQAPKKGKDSADFEEFKQKVGDSYRIKHISDAVKIDDSHFITFDKVPLEKEFCFGYSNYGMTEEEASEMCANFGEKEFKEANLHTFDSKFWTDEKLEIFMTKKGGCLVLENGYLHNNGATECDIKDVIHWPAREGDVILTPEQSKELKAKYLEVVRQLRTKFAKQIDNYLKKYGTTKIRKWIYWVDE